MELANLNYMQLHTQSNLWLVGSGALLFVLGALTVQATLLLHGSSAETPTMVQTNDTAAQAPTDAEDKTAIEDTTPSVTWPPRVTEETVIDLPQPSQVGTVSVEEALAARRSNRSYATTSLTLEDLGQMLWAAEGVNDPETEKRTVPSRGEAYPIQINVGVNRVSDLAPGLYEYLPVTHQLQLVRSGTQAAVWEELTGQPHPQGAAAVLLLTADMERGEDYYNSTLQESGHVGQNLYLQAAALDLHMLVMGGFDRALTRQYVNGTATDEPVYMVPIGNPVAEKETTTE